MTDELRSFLILTIWADVALLASLGLTLWRPSGDSSVGARRQMFAIGLAAVLVHLLHFSEEWKTRLFERIPEVTGLAAWPEALFVGFNLAWVGVWTLSTVGVWVSVRAALWPLWFLGIGSVVNLIAHPLLAVAVGGYFPGLWTSPLCGVAGVFLLRGLTRFTGSRQWERKSA